jgi:hypothetical protein
MSMRATFGVALLSLLSLGAGCLAQQVAPADGSLAAGVYHNAYFGFDYKLPAGFVDKTAKLPVDRNGITHALLYAAAPAGGTDSVFILAEDARYYWRNGWSQHTGVDYLKTVTQSIANRAVAIGSPRSVVIGGQTFYLQEYHPRDDRHVPQTMLATVMDGYVLTVTFSCENPVQRAALLAAFETAHFHLRAATPAAPQTTASAFVPPQSAK